MATPASSTPTQSRNDKFNICFVFVTRNHGSMKVNNIDIINIFCAIFHTLMMSKINDENWGESFLFFAIVRDPPKLALEIENISFS